MESHKLPDSTCGTVPKSGRLNSAAGKVADTVQVSFSYKFLSGRTVTGTVMGLLQPDQVTVLYLYGLDARYSGEQGTPLTFVSTLSDKLQLDSAAHIDNILFGGFQDRVDTGRSISNFGFSIYIGTINGAAVGVFKTSGVEFEYPADGNTSDFETFRPAGWTAVVI